MNVLEKGEKFFSNWIDLKLLSIIGDGSKIQVVAVPDLLLDAFGTHAMIFLK